MGWDVFSDKTVKCRKPHKCCLCGIEIKAGETARYFSGKWEGEWSDGYECEYCREFIKKLISEDLLDRHEFGEDEYHEAATEYLCGTCEHECDMTWEPEEVWDKYIKERLNDNERCRLGAYVERCRCEHRKEKLANVN